MARDDTARKGLDLPGALRLAVTIISLAGILTGGAWFLARPHLEAWVMRIAARAEIGHALTARLEGIDVRLAALDHEVSVQAADGHFGPPCVLVPTHGHSIEPGPPGAWVVIEWQNLERLRECGKPELNAVIRNGHQIAHTAELSTDGVDLPVGLHRSLRYLIRIPPDAIPGTACATVTVTFPRAENPPAPHRSPFVCFQIQEVVP
ncbi:MAG: hypothetical protein AAF899_12945 [Pseudomonadota bacterium]